MLTQKELIDGHLRLIDQLLSCWKRIPDYMEQELRQQRRVLLFEKNTTEPAPQVTVTLASTVAEFIELTDHVNAHFERSPNCYQCMYCNVVLDLSTTISTMLTHAAMHAGTSCSACEQHLTRKHWEQVQHA